MGLLLITGLIRGYPLSEVMAFLLPPVNSADEPFKFSGVSDQAVSFPVASENVLCADSGHTTIRRVYPSAAL